jgi:hypothetical protein
MENDLPRNNAAETADNLSNSPESPEVMVNPDFEPTDAEETILDVLKTEYRANPYLIRERTDLGKGEVNTAMVRLTSAGWVSKVTRGLYEFVEDPREEAPDNDTEPPAEADGVDSGGPYDPSEEF